LKKRESWKYAAGEESEARKVGTAEEGDE